MITAEKSAAGTLKTEYRQANIDWFIAEMQEIRRIQAMIGEHESVQQMKQMFRPHFEFPSEILNEAGQRPFGSWPHVDFIHEENRKRFLHSKINMCETDANCRSKIKFTYNAMYMKENSKLDYKKDSTD